VESYARLKGAQNFANNEAVIIAIFILHSSRFLVADKDSIGSGLPEIKIVKLIKSVSLIARNQFLFVSSESYRR